MEEGSESGGGRERVGILEENSKQQQPKKKKKEQKKNKTPKNSTQAKHTHVEESKPCTYVPEPRSHAKKGR